MKKQMPTPMSDTMNPLEFRILMTTRNACYNNASATEIYRHIVRTNIKEKTTYCYVALKIRHMIELGYMKVWSNQAKAGNKFDNKRVGITEEGWDAAMAFTRYLSCVDTTTRDGSGGNCKLSDYAPAIVR